MVDCGADWLKALNAISPTAIVLTHAHSDHAFGLARGAPCPVYATEATWTALSRFPLQERRVVEPRKPFRVGGVDFEAFPLEHSLRAPAMGYRMSKRGRKRAVFYVPDVAAIHCRRAALRGIDLYIGDGATIRRSMVRRRDHALIGHAPIAAQLEWCQREGVGHAIFTHCGSEIVRNDPRAIAAKVGEIGIEHGVEALVAYDGLTLSF
jgi:phosphoribosyl 1,2-cyclic phosphodiesterase